MLFFTAYLFVYYSTEAEGKEICGFFSSCLIGTCPIHDSLSSGEQCNSKFLFLKKIT
ncbi:hypothetical protein D922_01629 [Enterococcus faecalis 06-MB-DW-09]|nr:hypothetical protein D922_01629 [Enterococcus faecalis 06-MB-DW-09]